MACGCGGECCGQLKGLGFLSTESGGGGDYWGFDNSFWDSNSGGDWGGYYPWDYGFYDTVGGDYYDPATNTFIFPGNDSTFLPNGQQSYGSGNWNWQGLLDWWRELTTPRAIQPPTESPSIFAPYSGYCPPNTYCVDFPTCTRCLPIGNDPSAKAKAAAQKAAQAAAAKAAAQKQQAAQPCPPNTGLVKNAQGQCVCPSPLLFSKSAGKCVLASQLTQADKDALAKEQPDWVKIIGIGALVILGVRVLKK